MTSNIEKQLSEQGVYVSTTVGWSMFPMLRNRRDRIVVLPIGERKLKKYELPLYRRPDGNYVLHRVIGVKEDHYVIRGDNTYRREYVPKEWILGYVSEFYRNGKRISSDSKVYRTYAAFWQLVYPARLVAHEVYRVFSKLCRAIFGRKKDSDIHK